MSTWMKTVSSTMWSVGGGAGPCAVGAKDIKPHVKTSNKIHSVFGGTLTQHKNPKDHFKKLALNKCSHLHPFHFCEMPHIVFLIKKSHDTQCNKYGMTWFFYKKLFLKSTLINSITFPWLIHLIKKFAKSQTFTPPSSRAFQQYQKWSKELHGLGGLWCDYIQTN